MNPILSRAGLERCFRGTRRAVLAGLICVGVGASAETIYWKGKDGSWYDLANWSVSSDAPEPAPAAEPGEADDVVFNISTALERSVVKLDGTHSVRSILFRSDLTGGQLFEGGSSPSVLMIGAGGILSESSQNLSMGSNEHGQEVDVEVAASQVWALTERANNFFFRNGLRSAFGPTSQTLVIDSEIVKFSILGTVGDGSGEGKLSLWKRGSGALLLDDSKAYEGNSYSGTTTLQAGTLEVASAGALGKSALELAGGTLHVGVGVTFTAPAAVSMSGGVTSLTTGSKAKPATLDLGTVSRPVGAGVLARNLQDTGTVQMGNSLTHGIIGPWAYGQTAVNVPTWLTIKDGLVAAADLTVIEEIHELNSPTGIYRTDPKSAAGKFTLDMECAAYVWAHQLNNQSTELGGFTLTLSAFANGAFNHAITSEFGGQVVIGGDELVLIPANGTIIIAAPIAAGSGHVTIAPYGNGNATLAGNNAHTGGTSIHKNTLSINSPEALGTGTFTISGGHIDNSSESGPHTLATNNAQVWNSDFDFIGTHDLDMGSGAVSLGTSAGATRTITVVENTLTINGAIADGTHAQFPTKGLTKSGEGTLVLGGKNTYSGPTNVMAGTLLVNGSTVAGDVHVAEGATLGGTGTIGGKAIIDGTHAPGNSPGLQTFLGDLDYGSTSTFIFELVGNSASGVGVSYDGVLVGGDLTIAEGASFDVVLDAAGSKTDFSDPFWAANRSWQVFEFTGSGSENGSFVFGSISGDSASNHHEGYGTFTLTASDEGIYLNWVASSARSKEEVSGPLISALSGTAKHQSIHRGGSRQ